MTQIMYAQNPEGTNVVVFSIQRFRWQYYCAAFNVETMEGLFDHASDVEAIARIDAAVARIDADPATFGMIGLSTRPVEYKTPNQLKAEILSIKKFLQTFPGSTIHGSYADPDNP